MGVGVAWAMPTDARAGKLDSVRSGVRNSGSSSSSSSSSSSTSSSSSSSSSSDWESSWSVDWSAASADNAVGESYSTLPQGPRIRTTYAPYPYRDGYDGYVRRELWDDPNPIGRDTSGFLALEGFYLGDRVFGPGLSLGVDYRRLGIESNLDWLVEGMLEDAMYLGSTNGRFGLVMQPQGRVYVGFGLQYMVDGRAPGQGTREYALGPNLLLGGELFPVRPLVFSARAELGTLYEALSVKARLDVGVVLHGVGLFGGYQIRNIAGIPMHGPTVGLRMWL